MERQWETKKTRKKERKTDKNKTKKYRNKQTKIESKKNRNKEGKSERAKSRKEETKLREGTWGLATGNDSRVRAGYKPGSLSGRLLSCQTEVRVSTLIWNYQRTDIRGRSQKDETKQALGKGRFDTPWIEALACDVILCDRNPWTVTFLLFCFVLFAVAGWRRALMTPTVMELAAAV